MKKQILIFATFTLAIMFAGMRTYGQAPNLNQAPPVCLTPTLLDEDCEGGHLNPSPGTSYVYTVNVPNLGVLPGSGAANITWVVTTSQTFIDENGFVAVPDAADGTEYVASIGSLGDAYNTATPVDVNGNSSIEITWSAFTHDADNPVFLVAYATDAGGVCTSDNMEAWIIEPKHSFTLDIANLDLEGELQGDNYATCVAPVASAVYNGSGNIINFNFGVNYMFFQVSAANFSGSWQPSFQLSGDAFADSRETTLVEWSYDGTATGTWHPMTPDAAGTTWTTTTENVEAQDASGSVGSEGECIVVRVTIANNQAETIVAETVTLAVNGTMEDPANAGSYANSAYDDIDALDCTATDFDDTANQVLTPRPAIIEDTPDDGFVPTDKD